MLLALALATLKSAVCLLLNAPYLFAAGELHRQRGDWEQCPLRLVSVALYLKSFLSSVTGMMCSSHFRDPVWVKFWL